MTLSDEDRNVLTLFVRQARMILDPNLVEGVMQSNLTFQMRPGELTVASTRASFEMLTVLAVRVRVLTLPSEAIRVERSKHGLGVHDRLRRYLTTPRGIEVLDGALKAWRDAHHGWAYEANGKPVTSYDAFRLWFYSSVAHADADKAEEWDRRQADELERHILPIKVQDFLMDVLQPVATMATIANHLVEAGEEPIFDGPLAT